MIWIMIVTILLMFCLTGDRCWEDRRWVGKGNQRHCVQFHSNCERQSNAKALGRQVKSEARNTTLMWNIDIYMYLSATSLSDWLKVLWLIKFQIVMTYRAGTMHVLSYLYVLPYLYDGMMCFTIFILLLTWIFYIKTMI